ncbi:hypothetical protein FOL47_000901 [Perkinsus chesapeaki]|uniref:Uncharacterized protein n=1 Tax=Perkinsus chesapeaki TaxID=330153 RepID=A0A7J6KUP6_PERCH|nr:hypothetical protein FOL47_000901 [Perkinsus chesapeaki]
MSSTTTTGSNVHRRSKLDICPKDAIGRRKYQAVLSSRINAKSKSHGSNKRECCGFQKLPPGFQAAILAVNAGIITVRPPVSLIPPRAYHPSPMGGNSACNLVTGQQAWATAEPSPRSIESVQQTYPIGGRVDYVPAARRDNLSLTNSADLAHRRRTNRCLLPGAEGWDKISRKRRQLSGSD